MKWTKAINRIVMKCYIKSDPSRRRYKKRVMDNWNDIGVFKISEQRSADQARAIKTNSWLTDIKIEEIKRNIGSEDARDDLEEEREATTGVNYEEEEMTGREKNFYAESTSQFDHIAEEMRSEGLSEDKISILQMIQ